MTHIDTTIHPKITRYCAAQPSAVVESQLNRFCNRVEVSTVYRLGVGWHYRVDLFGFQDLRNLFVIDILLQENKKY